MSLWRYDIPAHRPYVTNQHYVPQFHLRAFQSPEHPKKVWRFDKEADRTELRSIKSSASAPDYYSTEDESGAKDDFFEHVLGDIESRAAPVVHRVCGLAAGVHHFDQEERVALSAYIGLLRVRGPASRSATQAMADFTARVVADMNLANADGFPERARDAGMSGTDDELEAWRLEELERLRLGSHTLTTDPQMSLINLETGLRDIGAILAAMQWYIVRVDRAPYLVLSDAPVAVVRPPDLPDFMGVGPATPGAVVQVPLAPYCLLELRHEELLGDHITVVGDPYPGVWPAAAGRLWWHQAYRHVFGRTRGDLDAVAALLDDHHRLKRPVTRVSGLPEEWKRYLPPEMRAD